MNQFSPRLPLLHWDDLCKVGLEIRTTYLDLDLINMAIEPDADQIALQPALDEHVRYQQIVPVLLKTVESLLKIAGIHLYLRSSLDDGHAVFPLNIPELHKTTFSS
ncbi:TPA: hypothetical protein ACJ51G_001029 [Aeromonas hydrophila subsp. hydrophila]